MKTTSFFSTSFDDPEVAAVALGAAYARIGVEPLQGSALDLQVSAAITPTLQIYRSISTTGLHFHCGERFAGFNINRTLTGRVHSQSGQRVFTADPETSLLTDARQIDRNTAGAGSVNNGLALPIHSLQSKLTQFIGHDLAQDIRFSHASLPQPLAQGCESLSDLLFQGLQPGGFLVNNPIAVTNIEDAIYNSILFGVEHNYSTALTKRHADTPRIVRLTIDYMEAHAHLPVTTAEVASAIGTNLRTLQLAFRRYLDTTPNAYMRGLRLANAHRDLQQNPGLSVSTIARKWGFHSSGEFARLYFDKFGERPSETRR